MTDGTMVSFLGIEAVLTAPSKKEEGTTLLPAPVEQVADVGTPASQAAGAGIAVHLHPVLGTPMLAVNRAGADPAPDPDAVLHPTRT